MPSPSVSIISIISIISNCFLRDSADCGYVIFDVADSPAVLAPRVKGSLYPFRWVARWHPSAPIQRMVYIGFQLISTGYLPDDEIAPFLTTQKCWDVRDPESISCGMPNHSSALRESCR